MSQNDSDKATNTGWSLDEFLAAVSHELRNANWSILGWAEVISKTPDDAETLAKGIRAIKRSARLQTELINKLLEFSRISSGGTRLDTRRVELVSTIEEVIETMTPLARAKAVELRPQLYGSNAVVLADRLRLEQVFTNLLSNAIKFTPPGGQVQVRLECGTEYAEIAISDTGRGISPEFLPYVFDRYRQETANAAEPGGLGLGLAIARYLIEGHGGRICADSGGEGKGATFTIYFPLESYAVRAEGQRLLAAAPPSKGLPGMV